MPKVRMLNDHPPGALGKAVVFKRGETRFVDPERAAKLIADGQAEEWTAEADTPAPAPRPRPQQRHRPKDEVA